MFRIYPSWTHSLGAMIEVADQSGHMVGVWCSQCKGHRFLDRVALVALAEIKVRDFSLVNKRTWCRLTPDCKGWNAFKYQSGVMWHLSDTDVRSRWIMEGFPKSGG